MRIAAAALLVCSLGVLPATGQQDQSAKVSEPAQTDDTLKVEVSLVQVFFSVHDRHNGLVGNLNKNDFTVFEDGKQQEIKAFERETDLPITMGLLIDVSKSQENLLDITKEAASQFFGAVLRQKDQAFLIAFGPEADLLQDYTNSPKLLRAGLKGLKVDTDFGGGVMASGPVPTISQPRGTILYDAVYLAAHDQLRNQVGRKALVLITDGDDQGSRYKITDAIEAAQKADAIIFSIQYTDPRYHGFFGGGDGALKRMSEETGGRVFHVSHKEPLSAVFQEIQDELRTQYQIAYASTNTAKDGTFRRIEIKVDNKDDKVQARKGYYAMPSAE
jgi:VWFA-related protein